VVQVLEQALALKPRARFPSALDFSNALTALVPRPADVTARLSSALRSTPWPPPSRPELEPVPEPPAKRAAKPPRFSLRRLFFRRR
jgi:hypothetical protein